MTDEGQNRRTTYSRPLPRSVDLLNDRDASLLEGNNLAAQLQKSLLCSLLFELNSRPSRIRQSNDPATDATTGVQVTRILKPTRF